jgi:hypothetical protein
MAILSENLPRQVCFLMTEEMYQALRLAAFNKEIGMAEYLRMVLEKDL